MATRYVRKTGSDSNGGTSPSDAWLTLGKAFGAAGIASGDTLYVGGGTYRENFTIAMTSATVETKIFGDVDGSHTGDAGDVVWTAYTTNDTTAPVNAALCLLNTRDFLTWDSFIFVGGGTNSNGNIFEAAAGSSDMIFRRCTFISGSIGSSLRITTVPGVALNWTFDQCIFEVLGSRQVSFICVKHTADYDLNVLFRNCLFVGNSQAVGTIESGSGTGFAGGIRFLNCHALGCTLFVTANAGFSTAIPATVYNCLILSGGAVGLSANVSGHIVEDYNIIQAATPRTNVTAGANSKTDFSRFAGIELGQTALLGRTIRAFGVPMAGAGILGWGGNTPPSVDLLNRPRPAGGQATGAAVGAFERHDTAVRETGTVHSGTNGLSITGPGDHELTGIPVDAVATSITIWARYDSGHAATNKPQVQLTNGTECGVADQTVTMTAAVDTWEQLTLTFTPTTKGIVTLRMISRSAAGSGKAFFDDLDFP
jgi:hypothetical protein